MPRATPRLDWLDAARHELNADPAFRKLGSTDVRLALAIGDVAKLVSFEAFEIAAVEDLEEADLRDADLVIRMSPKDWNAYLRKRARGAGPSLLTLDLETPGGIVGAANPLKKLLFERYNRSLQAFVDRGARLAA